MRIAAYATEGRRRLAAVEEGQLWPLAPDADVLELIAAEPGERDELLARSRREQEPLALADVRLLAPLHPTTLRDFVSFEKHVEGVVKSGGDPNAQVMPDWYTAPHFYFSNTNVIYGPGDDVPRAAGCELLDFELEVAAVIGRPGTDIAPEDARPYIAAYTIFNDWSARDLGAREVRLALGMCKAKDFANTLGPWLVTADELERYRDGDRLNLELVATVNDRENGRDTLASMAWSFEEFVAYASRGSKIMPGDVLGSGTCGGGCLAELWGRNGAIDPPALQSGDVVTLSVEGIGTLSNRVVAGPELKAIPAARRRSTAVGA